MMKGDWKELKRKAKGKASKPSPKPKPPNPLAQYAAR